MQHGFHVIAISIEEPALYDLQEEARDTTRHGSIQVIGQDLSTAEGQNNCLQQLSEALLGKQCRLLVQHTAWFKFVAASEATSPRPPPHSKQIHKNTFISSYTYAPPLLPMISVRLLINNVGLSSHEPVNMIDHPRDQLQAMIAVNCLFTSRITHALLPALAAGKTIAAHAGDVQQRSGMLIVSSLAGTLPAPLCAVYGATKAFGLQLARSLHVESAAAGIDCMAVLPGMVAAGNTAAWFGQGRMRRLDVASPRQMATSSLRMLGETPWCAPFWVHAVQLAIMRRLPEAWSGAIVYATNGAAARHRRPSQ